MVIANCISAYFKMEFSLEIDTYYGLQSVILNFVNKSKIHNSIVISLKM